MKTIRRLLRQPGRSAAGLLLIGLAVAALIVCLGQNLAADQAQRRIQENYRTAALLTEAYQYETKTIEVAPRTEELPGGGTVEIPGETIEYQSLMPVMPEEISAWVDALPGKYPEYVSEVSDHGLASAYIPELKPDLYASYEPEVPMVLWNGKISDSRSQGREPKPFGAPYDYAMMEITLTKIGTPTEESITDPVTGEVTPLEGISLILEGTVDQILALQEGYPDCLGFTVHLYLNLPDRQTLDGLDLETGARYLVYGTHYYDLDWVLRDQIGEYYSNELNRKITIDAFDPENLRLYDETIWEKYESYGQQRYSVGYYIHNGELVSLDNMEYAMFRKVYLELDWAENHGTDPAFLERYQIPNIVRLDGDADGFLESDGGALWKETLEQLEVTGRSFPVLAVDQVGNVGEFIRGSLRIVSGREFTSEESAAGEKLCVISETVAAASGLSVGDTITLNIYSVDRDNPYQYFLEDGVGVTNPAAYRFGRTTPFENAPEEYTIVGLYRSDGAWASVEDNIYAISPNTVLVPKNALSCPLSTAKQAAFRTVILHNEALREFIIMADEAGYGELFLFYDQGYNTIAQSIAEYRIIAGRAALVGGIIYGMILLVYLMLFPGQLRKDLMIMDSLGAGRVQQIGHVMAHSFGLLFGGTILGSAGGALLWNRVSQALTATAEVSLDLELDLWGFLQLSGGQLILAMGCVLILAIGMTRPRTLDKRR